jgi:Cytochrome C oxidase, cbb3-type, subunit III
VARFRVTSHFTVVTALALCLLGALSSQCFSQDQEEGTGVNRTAEFTFLHYCANCHGDGGRGDCPKVFGLSQPPPDLTTLTKRNGGVFPRERLQGIIDGRLALKNHGDREMPAWGMWFKMEAAEDLGGAEGDEATVQRRITDLIDFLESLQDSKVSPFRHSSPSLPLKDSQ